MKNPTYAKFMAEIESIISPLAKDELKKIIFSLAESQSAPERNGFLKLLRHGMPAGKKQAGKDENGGISPKELVDAIKEFKQRILDGEFYDEERSGWVYEMEERSYYGGGYDYYGEDIDYANEEYVHEAVALLEDAKRFFRQQDIDTAYKAYKMLFDIFENDEFYDCEKANALQISEENKSAYLAEIKLLAVNRVSHILENKLRGGYESACLLLVACAEVSQIIENRGDELIRKVDAEYKRFRAFRSALKDYTRRSRVLHTVS